MIVDIGVELLNCREQLDPEPRALCLDPPSVSVLDTTAPPCSEEGPKDAGRGSLHDSALAVEWPTPKALCKKGRAA